MRILVFDPGENTGWVEAEYDESGLRTNLTGGTAVRDHAKVAELFDIFNPTHIVYETFNLYPGMARNGTMNWNSFYPCEVIGVIKYLAQRKGLPIYGQSPSIKKYSGGLQQDWVVLRERCAATEHMKDAYLHLKYFERNNKDFRSLLKASQ